MVDRLQPGFSSEDSRILEVGNLVRKSIWKNGQPGKGSFNDSKKASAGTNNWSEDLYRIARTYPGRAWSNTTYALAQTNNDGTAAAEINGKWTRQALLSVPEETLQNLDGNDTDDDDDNDTDDDDDNDTDDDEPMNDVETNNPRPIVIGTWRYKVGDVLRFRKDFFVAAPGGLGGLENSLQERTGIIQQQSRERPRGKNKGIID